MSADERMLRKNVSNREMKDILHVLTTSEKNCANKRVKLVSFTPECTGYKRDVFTTASKDHHGLEEVS